MSTEQHGLPPEGDAPRHVQLAETLRAEILEGRLSPGERLSPERELAERFDVARTTVRLALSALKSQGLVGAGQGKGTFVQKRRPVRVLASYQDNRARRRETTSATFNAEIARQGRIGRQDIREVGPVLADTETAKWLGVPEGTELLVRRRVMLVDEEPYQLGDSYYLYETVRDTPIAQPDPVEEGVLSVLERAHGKPVDYYVDELSFRMPTPEEASVLTLDSGICVVRAVRIAYDPNGRPMEAFDQLLAGDKHVLVYQVPSE
jgi:GntR family transcriptional regulator